MRLNPASNCGCCGCVNWTTCWSNGCHGGDDPAFELVRVEDSSGTVVASGSTDSSGCFTASIPSSGTYTAYLTVAGVDYASDPKALACGADARTSVAPEIPIASIGLIVASCFGGGAIGVPFARIMIGDPSGAVTTLTADINGQAAYHRVLPGLYTMTASAPGYITGSQQFDQCTPGVHLALAIDANVWRCCACGPLPKAAVFLTDEVGGLTAPFFAFHVGVPADPSSYYATRGDNLDPGPTNYAGYAVGCVTGPGAGAPGGLALSWNRWNAAHGFYSGTMIVGIAAGCNPLAVTFDVPAVPGQHDAFSVTVTS